MTPGNLLRAFIAIEIPPAIQGRIRERCRPVHQALGPSLVRWVAAENVHLTLKFLGDVSRENLELLASALRHEVALLPAMRVQVGGFGAFPNPRRARVLWIGLQAPPGLAALQHLVEQVCEHLGYPREERPFSAHLTVGRVSQHAGLAELARIQKAVETTQIEDLGSPEIDAVSILTSELRPTGPVYTRLHQLPLAPASKKDNER